MGAACALEYVSRERASLAARNLRVARAIPNIEHAVTFLDGHADADIAHVAYLERRLGEISDTADRRDIEFSSRTLCVLYPWLFAKPSPCGAFTLRAALAGRVAC